MAERIHSFDDSVSDGNGVEYNVSVYGSRRSTGDWVGWLLYEPTTGSLPALRTRRETSQADREDLQYWAAGLEHVYLEGALARARPV